MAAQDVDRRLARFEQLAARKAHRGVPGGVEVMALHDHFGAELLQPFQLLPRRRRGDHLRARGRVKLRYHTVERRHDASETSHRSQTLDVGSRFRGAGVGSLPIRTRLSDEEIRERLTTMVTDLEVVERFAGAEAIPEFGCLGFQVLVGESLEPGLGLVDRGDDALELSECLAFPGTQDLGEDWH